MTILRGFKVDCLDVNLIPTKEVWRALRQNYAIHSSRENLSYKWQKTPNDPKLPLISFQTVLFWWWFIAVESMLDTEKLFLKWTAGKGWLVQEAVFLNGDIGNFLLFPQKNFPRDKKFPCDKNHFDFSSRWEKQRRQIQLEPISRRRFLGIWRKYPDYNAVDGHNFKVAHRKWYFSTFSFPLFKIRKTEFLPTEIISQWNE